MRREPIVSDDELAEWESKAIAARDVGDFDDPQIAADMMIALIEAVRKLQE